MSESVGIRELQQNASKVVARATGGEEIEITDRGRPVARLVPLRRSPLEELADAGRLGPATRVITALPEPIVSDGATASEILAELRADEIFAPR
jgi:prevent-host-death family protein